MKLKKKIRFLVLHESIVDDVNFTVTDRRNRTTTVQVMAAAFYRAEKCVPDLLVNGSDLTVSDRKRVSS
jgi:hypothetical protein